jgi:hypothetical protein
MRETVEKVCSGKIEDFCHGKTVDEVKYGVAGRGQAL